MRDASRLQQLGAAHGLPLVATGDVHMHAPERRALQDTLTAIRHRCTLAAAGHRLFPNGERHLRSYEQLRRIYPRELLDETLRVAQRCEFSLNELRYRYPRELVPPGMEPCEHLRKLTEAGLQVRWPEGVPEKIRAVVEKELALIKKLQVRAFLSHVHEIVQWDARPAEADPVPGPRLGGQFGRVLRAAHHRGGPRTSSMLFERFISAERNEPPDIDVDFEHEGEEVIQHVFEKYGRERAALAATVITYRPKSAMRDVGRALGLDPRRDRSPRSAGVLGQLGNVSRQAIAAGPASGCGRHPAVVRAGEGAAEFSAASVAARRRLRDRAEDRVSDLVPIENAAMPERTVIQWDKNDLESLGLLKVDVLALGMLTASAANVRSAGEGRHRPHEHGGDSARGSGDLRHDLPRRYDRRVPDRVARADEHVAAAAAAQLLRPGHRDRDRAARTDQGRHGASLSAATPSAAGRSALSERGLRPVLEKTRGVPIFQEQVMQIAVVAAGFTPGEADQLRRAMGAWQRSGNMGMYQQKLMDGMRAKGYSEAFAEADLQADRRVRRIRLSGIAFGVVRAAHVRFELAEAASPRGVLRRA